MQTPVTRRSAALATALLALCAGVRAQTTPAATPAAPASDEVLRLSDFTVTASQASGYRATNSITATGIGTAIADAPVPINVLTADFIKDVNQMRMADALVYVPGIVNASYESVIQIRGFQGLQLYRNGFYRRQSYPTWNVDRIEVIKGAASVFYGVVRPGGVINYLTGKPSFDGNFTDVKISLGSDEFYKGEAYSNFQVNDQLAFRVGLGGIEGGAWRDNEFNRQYYQGLSTTWKPAKNHEISLDLEHLYWKFTDPRGIDLGLTNSAYYNNPAAIASGLTVGAWVAANLPAGTPIYNTFPSPNPKGRDYKGGNDVWSEQESHTLDLTYKAQLTDSLVFTSGFNAARDFFEELRTINNDHSPYADGTFAYQFGRFGNTRKSWNFNNKLVWRFDVAGSRNTVQFGQEYFHVVQRTPGLYTAAGTFQDGIRSASFRDNAAQAEARSGTAALAATGLVFNMDRSRKDGFQGYYVMNQTELFESRLHLLYGARYNKAERSVSYSRAVGNPEPSSRASKTTPEYGGLFKISKDVSFFATYSETLEAPFGADIDGRPVDAVENSGYDVGFKTSLFDGRVSSTLTYYDTERDHVATRDSAREAATGKLPYFIYNNTARSRGIEADINLAITNEWSALVGVTHDLENKYTASTDPLLRGQPLGGVAKNYVTLWTRYDFAKRGSEGLYVAGGARYTSGARITTDQIGISANNIVRYGSSVVFDATVGYHFKLDGRLFTTSLDVKNVFDREYRDGVDGAWAPPRRIFVSLGTKF